MLLSVYTLLCSASQMLFTLFPIQVVASGEPTGVNASGCVTLEGFLFLHLLFIEKSNLESIWVVLRKFGACELPLLLAPLFMSSKAPLPGAVAFPVLTHILSCWTACHGTPVCMFLVVHSC